MRLTVLSSSFLLKDKEVVRINQCPQLVSIGPFEQWTNQDVLIVFVHDIFHVCLHEVNHLPLFVWSFI